MLTATKQKECISDIPCGRCDVGIYSHAAAFTPLALRLVAQNPEDRQAPRCKSMDRACVGACDFIDAIGSDLESWLKLKDESA